MNFSLKYECHCSIILILDFEKRIQNSIYETTGPHNYRIVSIQSSRLSKVSDCRNKHMAFLKINYLDWLCLI